MRMSISIAAVAAFLVFGASGTAQVGEATLDGVWLPVEAEFSGKPFADKVLKTMKLTMSAGKYSVNISDSVDKGEYKVKSSVQPKELDIVGTDGPAKGKRILAIFELNGDSLRVCYDFDGKTRPAAFKTEEGGTQFLVSYKREKR